MEKARSAHKPSDVTTWMVTIRPLYSWNLQSVYEDDIKPPGNSRLSGVHLTRNVTSQLGTPDFVDFAAQPGVDEKPIRGLATRRFLDDASNALFVGPPGVGKTMVATALVRGAAEAGNRVHFTTAADLAARDSVASGAPPSVVWQGGTTTTLSSASTTPLRSEACEADDRNTAPSAG